jgi:hypothetical protein
MTHRPRKGRVFTQGWGWLGKWEINEDSKEGTVAKGVDDVMATTSQGFPRVPKIPPPFTR